LTTLLMKHFPTFKTKFRPDPAAPTMAPKSWRLSFSQRRRRIDLAVHNLCELAFLPELFSFSCFSMRFFVLLNLIGTVVSSWQCCLMAFFLADYRSSRRHCQPLSSTSVLPEPFFNSFV
jgi:chitin synthase